jgi:hypothetical protein
MIEAMAFKLKKYGPLPPRPAPHPLPCHCHRRPLSMRRGVSSLPWRMRPPPPSYSHPASAPPFALAAAKLQVVEQHHRLRHRPSSYASWSSDSGSPSLDPLSQVDATGGRASLPPHCQGVEPRRLRPDGCHTWLPLRRLPPDLSRPPPDTTDTCSSGKGSAILLAASAGTSVGSLRLPGVVGLGSDASVGMLFRLAPRRKVANPVPIVCAAVLTPVAADPTSLVPALIVCGLAPSGHAVVALGLASLPVASKPTVVVLSLPPIAPAPSVMDSCQVPHVVESLEWSLVPRVIESLEPSLVPHVIEDILGRELVVAPPLAEGIASPSATSKPSHVVHLPPHATPPLYRGCLPRAIHGRQPPDIEDSAPHHHQRCLVPQCVGGS